MKILGLDCCEICFSSDVEDDDLIFCDKCDSCVHLQCAHLAEDIVDAAQYICTYCLAGRPPCVLCNTQATFYAASLYQDFVHTVCYRFAPFQFDFDTNEQDPKVPQPEFIQRSTSDFSCQYCKGTGLVLNCLKCKTRAHVPCFILNNGAVSVFETETKIIARVLCSEHAGVQRTKQTDVIERALRNDPKLAEVFNNKELFGSALIGVRELKDGQHRCVELNSFQNQWFLAEQYYYRYHKKPDNRQLMVVGESCFQPVTTKLQSILLPNQIRLQVSAQQFNISEDSEITIENPSPLCELELKKELFRGGRVAAVISGAVYSFSFTLFDQLTQRELRWFVGDAEAVNKKLAGLSVLVREAVGVAGEVF